MAKKVISPHLTIYEPQVSSVFSIFHRITGGTMTLVFIVTMLWTLGKWSFALDPTVGPYWVLILAFEPEILKMCVVVMTACICYHFSNAIRHFVWDMGFGFSNEAVLRTATFGLILTSVLFLFATWFFVLPTFF
jgi:succinate dehydrogenase / fumarate reductase, cytochrome b subunit